MRGFGRLVDKISREMDKLAGVCFTIVMMLVVVNILLRELFNRPILGTYELVGYITALGVSLALARCAYMNGHIAVDYIAEKFPRMVQAATDGLMNLLALCFFLLTAWHLGEYAMDLQETGVVSATAQIPVYPVVLLIGCSFLGLCPVLFLKLCHCCQDFFGRILSSRSSISYGTVEHVRKAVR